MNQARKIRGSHRRSSPSSSPRAPPTMPSSNEQAPHIGYSETRHVHVVYLCTYFRVEVESSFKASFKKKPPPQFEQQNRTKSNCRFPRRLSTFHSPSRVTVTHTLFSSGRRIQLANSDSLVSNVHIPAATSTLTSLPRRTTETDRQGAGHPRY